MSKRWILLLPMILLVSFWGCSDDETPTDATATAFETLAAVGSAYINGAAPAIVGAADVAASRATYTILDVRRPEHYNAGHIEGAYNPSLGDLLDKIDSGEIPTNLPFLVVCYSGQSAGHAVLALRMLGYEAYSMKWGMSDWHSDLSGPWDGNTADLADEGDIEQTNNNGDLLENSFPELSGYSPSTVVRERVEEMLADGFQGISYADMLLNGLENYFIVNYFGETDYLGTGNAGVPGHLAGAYQFTPKASLGIDQMLENLPSDGTTIVVYCWTGQHSSQVTAYLNTLGYNAKSLSFGSNALWYSDLTDHNWTGTTNTYPTFEADAFEILAETGAAYINSTAPGVVLATDLATNLDDYTVLDFRQTTDYNNGHIEGAIDASLGSLMDNLGGSIPTDKPFMCVCYSGQSAGHAVYALQALGYEAYSLKWGMSDWNSTLSGPWTNNCDSLARENFEIANNNGDLTPGSFPDLDSYNWDTVVEERIDEMLTAGFQGIEYADMVLNGLENYFIINYFGEADYLGMGTSGIPGHLPGAYQFTPKASLGMDEMLDTLPTDGTTIVVYCWTGQTSSQVTAYLNSLGYNAKSLKFGSNKLWYNFLTAHKWGGDSSNSFPLVP